VRTGTLWGFENLDPRKYNEAMGKIQKLGRGRNEEHLNSKQKDFQRGKSQPYEKKFCSMSSSNFSLSSFIKFDYAMHIPTRSPPTSKCLKHLILGSLDQFLFTKII
jgi:hypothetical protein